MKHNAKEAFYSSLNMKDITDVDHRHVFENFRNMCIKVYELDLAHFLSAPRLAWQACLKKTGVELKLRTNVDMLLMIEKGIRGGICHAIHRYAKANNKYMIYYDENKKNIIYSIFRCKQFIWMGNVSKIASGWF